MRARADSSCFIEVKVEELDILDLEEVRLWSDDTTRTNEMLTVMGADLNILTTAWESGHVCL